MRRTCWVGFMYVAVAAGCPAVRPDPDAGAADAGSPDSGQVDAGTEDAGVLDAGRQIPTGPVVILMIGDGMGSGQLEAASLFRHGQAGKLFMQTLPRTASVTTASLSGLTDSAAAATTLATGVSTLNGHVGVDREGRALETLVERAHRLGLSAGVVTTASLPHATPGAFSAHEDARGDYVRIADDQAKEVKPEVMLGGGTRFFFPQGPGSDRTDQGLVGHLESNGFRVIYNRVQLAEAVTLKQRKLVGLFAAEHLDYVRDRAPDSLQPTLTEMSMAALRTLAGNDRGFFLMIEGARIDMASHLNDLPRTVDETLAFDDAVKAVVEATQGWPDVVVLVTADHECGGLRVAQPKPAGTLPEVQWRWLQHTNAPVSLFAQGADLAPVATHQSVHALMLSRLERKPLIAPPPQLLADGTLNDLKHAVVVQRVATGFGAGINQLQRLYLDADAQSLALGVEGLFEWNKNAVVILIDTDFGAGTGVASLRGALADHTGQVDGILASSNLGPPTSAGFGADFALVSAGGLEVRPEELIDGAGLRGLKTLGNLPWFPAVMNFGEGVRTTGVAPLRTGFGLEGHLAWRQLYPNLAGRVPVGATLAIAVVLVNDDGGFTSNQALPPFALGSGNPGRAPTPLPGFVKFRVDADSDGVPDGVSAPEVMP